MRKFFSIFAILFCVYFCFAFSYVANTWYTDFDFGGGLKSKSFTVLGGDNKQIYFYLKNLSDVTISGYFSVVDAEEMLTGVLVCKANGQDDVFGKYGTFQQTGFLIGGGETFSGLVNMKFPEGYSGDYIGCVTYTPSGDEDIGSINSQPRKALFLKATLSATASMYQLKVFPGSRSKPSLANRGEIRFYDANKTLVYFESGIVSNASGIATFSALIPDGIYTVVYKGQSHLASYLDNISVIAGGSNEFDFTTGISLNGVQNVNNLDDNGYRYQIAGDLENVYGVYDFMVNGNDISIITPFYGQEVEDLDPKDLNGDNYIDVFDIGIIGTNFRQQDVFFEGGIYSGLYSNI